MKIVENRVAYIVDGGRLKSSSVGSDPLILSPLDHLYGSVNLFNPYIVGLRHDSDERRLFITCTIDREHRIFDVLLGNVLGTRPIDIVDCQHGIFRGCQGEKVEISHSIGVLPQVSIEIVVDELEPWGIGEPGLKAYDLCDLSSYATSRVRRAFHAGKEPDSKQQRPSPLTWDDVKVHNVSLIMDWSENFEDLGRHTLSIHLTIDRDGTMSAKQTIVFIEASMDEDPASPAIIDNLSGRIRFSEPNASVSYLSAFRVKGKSGESEERPSSPVRFLFGRDSELKMVSPNLKDVTYVDAMMKYPRNTNGHGDGGDDEGLDFSDAIRYRLYYEGRIGLGK